MPVLAIGRVHAIAGRRDELVALMRTTAAEVRREAGCTTYEWTVALDEPDEFVLVQEWETQAALDAHYRGEPFKAYQRGVMGLLARPSVLTVHEVAAAGRALDPGPMDPRAAD